MSATTYRPELFKSTLIDHIVRVDLRVTDLDAAVAFYRDVVGLRVVERDGSQASLGAGGGAPFLMLDSAGVTGPTDPAATGLFHTAIRFPTRPALGDALARLVDAGLEVGAGDHLVSEALYVNDPAGNGVELYWDRPVEEWPGPRDGMLVPMPSLPVDLEGLLDAGRGRGAVEAGAPLGTDVGHVHLQVSNIEATTRFYGDELGLDVTARIGDSARFFSSNAYHHHIGSNVWRSRGGRAAPRHRAGLDRIVFAVSDAGDLEELRKRVSDLGQPVGQEAPAAVVHDPDEIELVFAAA
ncbi:MAG: VOC family protein [Actinomycetota bacterium]|nr:VOC family protein [Actinomycetota bacterium]